MVLRRAMTRARVILLNAALGPLDYRVPARHGGRAGLDRRRAARAAPADRRGLGAGAAARPRRSATTGCGRCSTPIDLPPLAAPLRRLIEWTADYYLAPLAAVLRMALPSSRRARGRAHDHRISRRPAIVPERLTPQRAQALERIGERQGLVRELAIIGGVSDGVIRGLVKAGAIEAVEVAIDDPFPDARSRTIAPPALEPDQADGRGRAARRRRRRRVRPLPARRRHRLGQDRGLFRGDRRGAPAGQAGAGPAPRDRADRALPEALRRPLRLRAGRLAFGPAPVAAPPRLARDRHRRGPGRGRRALGPVPALSRTSA